ncbi:MAG: indole-3-glycerol-phosphate synthase TrpC, partial [Nitrospirae bacterium]|nr:indole-3-glycerol-phosphate synthase TrpC [Nitrospirota bacterium]
MTVLDKIIAKKAQRLLEQKAAFPLSEIKKIGAETSPRDFFSAVSRNDSEPLKLIAEIKHASPSEGIIRHDFNLRDIARTYEQCRVNAVSILTEEDFFKGQLSYIEAAKEFLSCPVL